MIVVQIKEGENLEKSLKAFKKKFVQGKFTINLR